MVIETHFETHSLMVWYLITKLVFVTMNYKIVFFTKHLRESNSCIEYSNNKYKLFITSIFAIIKEMGISKASDNSKKIIFL